MMNHQKSLFISFFLTGLFILPFFITLLKANQPCQPPLDEILCPKEAIKGKLSVVGQTLAMTGEFEVYLPLIIADVASTSTSTPTPTRTPTMTNTPTLTPTIIKPTHTATISLSGTATRTPTPIVYANNPQPDAIIPDGPNGLLQSQIQVLEPLIIREMQVYLNISHDDVGELDIDIYSPNGGRFRLYEQSRIRLHSQGENSGEKTIQDWFPITGKDLAKIVGQSAQGTWSLEITDRFEDNIGTLGSWQIEIYP